MSVRNNFSSFVSHLLCALVYAFAMIWIEYNLSPLLHSRRAGSEFGGQFKRLTSCNLALQFVYFSLSLINDLTKNQSKIYGKLMTTIFASLAFPIAIFVTVSFWSIYAINPKAFQPIIYPEGLSSHGIVNQIIHTLIALTAIIELNFVNHNYWPSKKLALTLLTIFTSIYGIWILFIRLYIGEWVYYFLNHLNWFQSIVCFVAFVLLFLISYSIGEKLHQLYNKNKCYTFVKPVN